MELTNPTDEKLRLAEHAVTAMAKNAAQAETFLAAGEIDLAKKLLGVVGNLASNYRDAAARAK